MKAFALAVFQIVIGADDDTPSLRLERTLDAALAGAQMANSFVAVVLPRDHDGEGYGLMSGPFWSNRALREAAAKGRVLVGSRCTHTELEASPDRDGKRIDHACSRFGQILCQQHRDAEKQVVAKYFAGRDPGVRPVFLLLRGSDGAPIARRVGEATVAEVTDMFVVAPAAATAGEAPKETVGKAGEKDDAVRRRALRLLATVETEPAEAALRGLYDAAKDDARRAEILDAIAQVGARRLRDRALAVLETGPPGLRAVAARAIASSGDEDSVAPLVKAFPKAKDDEERKAIVRALGRCGRGSDAARDALKKAASDTRPLVRANAVVALGQPGVGDASTLALLKQKLESDGEARVRGAAAYSLAMAENADAADLVPRFRARRAKEKDSRVSEMLGSGVAWLEGSAGEDDLAWPLVVFCGDKQ